MSRSSAVSFIVTSTDSSRRTAQPKTLFCPTLKPGKSPHGRSSYASGNASAVSLIRRSIVLSRTAPFWRFRGRLGREPEYDSKTRKGASMAKSVKDAMTANPCTIDAGQTVSYAAKMMKDEDVGLAPVVEGQRLVGTLTDRDIV